MTDWSSEEEKYEGSLNHFDIKLRTTLTCDTMHTERITKLHQIFAFPRITWQQRPLRSFFFQL